MANVEINEFAAGRKFNIKQGDTLVVNPSLATEAEIDFPQSVFSFFIPNDTRESQNPESPDFDPTMVLDTPLPLPVLLTAENLSEGGFDSITVSPDAGEPFTFFVEVVS